MTDIYRYQSKRPLGWVFNFPNGHEASVISDPRTPFRFEVCLRGTVGADLLHQLGGDGRGLFIGLTTEQVEAKLAEIAELPQSVTA